MELPVTRPLAAVGLTAALCLAGSAAAAPGDDIYARPGQIVEADGARLNLYCAGRGAPTVLLDAGHQDWAPAWAVIQPQLASWTRVCSFDRSGYGFSPPGPMPRTSERIATELHDALHALAITGPYVLVGHAFGAMNMRAFAVLYPDEVQGLVLIEPDAIDAGTPQQVARAHSVFIRQAIEIQRCRDTLAAHLPQPPELACDQRFFRGLPEPGWSGPLNAAIAEAVHTRPGLSDAANAELTEIPGDELWLREHGRSLGAKPVRVITAAQHYSDTAATPPDVRARHERFNRDTIDAQAALLTLSSNAKQILATHSRAYVQFDEPQLVVQAIREAAGR
jgi:pimeloyl-ACP methyl ester carboxylesterase